MIAEAKVVDYLLHAVHPAGAPKAAYFERFGFSADRHVLLLQALLAHRDDNEVVQVQSIDYGVKSIVECRLATPDGRNPCIRSIWILETGSGIQRFVTAYPA